MRERGVVRWAASRPFAGRPASQGLRRRAWSSILVAGFCHDDPEEGSRRFLIHELRGRLHRAAEAVHAWSSAVHRGELLDVNALLTGVIGAAAALLGSFSTYLFQSRTAARAEAFARDERLRQEQLIACSAYAASLTNLKRGLISLWFHRKDESGPVWKEARAEADQLGASAEAARFRVQLVCGDSQLAMLADAAFAALGAIRTASDRTEMIKVEKRFEYAVKEFVAAAGARLRSMG